MFLSTAQDSDVAALLRLEQTAGGGWDRQRLAAELQLPWGSLLIAQQGQQLVGCCAFWQIDKMIEVHHMLVEQRLRRQGIGSALLAAVVATARRQHKSMVCLESRAGNTAALALYQRHGFKHVGSRFGYYTKPVEDAVLLTLTL